VEGVLIEATVRQSLDHMLGVRERADALPRQAKVLAELRRRHARDWARRPPRTDGDLGVGRRRLMVGRKIAHSV